ncbi:tyrosine decarboxylase MfnA [Salinarchaeum laminariae]|uniref:tyrosine decarboxylase MfnA n=1 Tax=Salinarchaeum laminariae TaxID=869888 RepID=UPI0020BD46CE|nr:tyrosine decarboxylase MfnA [Salinarchaeum laminariae]
MRAEPQSFDRVLSSMCTPPHPTAREAAEQFLATNPGDPATYPAVAEMEAEVVDALGEIASLSDPHGFVASGGTEANIQAVRAARDRSDARDPNVVAPETVHFSVRKAAEVLGVELRTTPVDDGFRADPAAIDAATDSETALIVGVAGSTEYGRVDPIPALGEVATDAGAMLHVDAAWGGFALPFTDHDWDFDVDAVDTLTIDPHKLGRAAIPAGGLLAREQATVDALAVETPYLESTTQATLTGTRSGAGVASAAAALDELWPEGYRESFERQQALAAWLATELSDLGLDVVEPSLPLVAADIGASAFDALREEGWRVSRTRAGELRVVCMPHVTESMLESFLADVRAVRRSAVPAADD